MLQKSLVPYDKPVVYDKQTRGLENKLQLWPILFCVIRRFLCPTICH